MTVPRPMQYLATGNCRSGRSGRSGPPLCGGIPPATPPLCIPPCVRVSSLSPTRPSCRRHRACAFPACPRRARRVDATVRARFQAVPDAPVVSTPPTSPTRPSCRRHRACAFPACPRRHRACAAPAVRTANHESRITAIPALPCAGGFPPQRPPCVYHRACAFPACPRRARRVDATVRARFQLVPDAHVRIVGGIPPAPATRPSCRRACAFPASRHHRACAAPAVRITNHESRITPALPCAGGFPPQRPPCVYYRASAFPSCPRRARRVDATVRARFHPVLDAPVMSTPPCQRVSILSPTRPSCRRHRTCASPANVSAPVVPPPPCVRVPGCRRRAANTMPPSGRIDGQSRVRPTSTAPSSSRPLTTDH